MKYRIEDLVAAIRARAKTIGEITVMEVCGTHTNSIQKYGIPSLLPENIKLVSGPGCPVCVTAQADIAAAVSIADQDDVIFACFGDMMRVPCADGSLYSLYESGRDVRLITSPLDTLQIAALHPKRQVVYFGIGFETTAPHTAALVLEAERQQIRNLTVLNAHKTMPRAIMQLLQGGSEVSALLCPGHVAAITGADAFAFVPEKLHLPAAVAGFEVYDILVALLGLVNMVSLGRVECVNMYPRAVTRQGNRHALELLYGVMGPADATWRGLGEIPASGLRFRERYAGFDARKRFPVATKPAAEPQGCLCARILRGEALPPACLHFGQDCTPDNPVGPCMVSAEGCCAAYYRYGGQ